MRLLTLTAALALAAPVWAQQSNPVAPPQPLQGTAGPAANGDAVAHVRVMARIVVVDREAVTRAGLDYVVLANDRIRVSTSTARDRARDRTRRGVLGGILGGDRDGWGARSGRGARIAVGTHGVTAFLDAVRESRWVRSESTQQVLTIAGGEGVVSATDLAVGRHASRTRGPSLVVSPSILSDGSVHLRVSARHEDSVTYAWGYGVDGSPAAVDAEIIVSDGQEVILASSSAVQSTREAGILRWGEAERGRDVLVAVSAEVVRH